jgi:phospholipid/cholesterol/gamma-HCH transport system permease protein
MTQLRRNIESLGAYGNMLYEVCRDVFRHGVNLRELSRQIVRMGLNSIPIVILTAGFTGMVLALQTAYGLHRFGAKNYVGNVVGLGLVRELGPVLTALMLSGRVGAGIAAEIASMVATEQVDAIRALGANPIRKLVSPRIIAGLIVMPLLAVIANLVGMWGGAMVAVYELDLTAHLYYRSLMYTLLIGDVFDGLIKSGCFGFFLVSIACFKGLRSRGGTEGVGVTTTEAVVTASIVIFVSDFFITKLLILLR